MLMKQYRTVKPREASYTRIFYAFRTKPIISCFFFNRNDKKSHRLVKIHKIYIKNYKSLATHTLIKWICHFLLKFKGLLDLLDSKKNNIFYQIRLQD